MEFICLAIPILLVLAIIIYSCVIGTRIWLRAKQEHGELALMLRYLALTMCEPIVGAPLVIATLALGSRFQQSSNFLNGILLCWPMFVLLVPLFGPRIHNHTYKSIVHNSVMLGVARLVLNASSFGILSMGNDTSNYIWLVFLLPLISIGCLLYTAAWVHEQISSLPAPPLPPLPPLHAQPITVARPSAAVAAVARVPIVLSHHNAVPCPDCREFAANDALVCEECGLVFASKIPVELQLLPRYSIVRPLCEGGMSQIYVAYDRAIGDHCAIKVATSREAQICLERETLLLRDLNHRGIVSLRGWYPDTQVPFAALNYIAGTSLEQQLIHGRVPLATAIGYASSAAETLCYLASRPLPVVHCDIKPGNLIIDATRAITTLLDFGSAIEIRAGTAVPKPQAADHYGTPGYAAPEQYRGNPTPRSDVYGLAATLYHLATGDDPTSHPLSFPALHTLPPALVDLLQPALAHDPEQRPTPFHLRSVLRELKGKFC